MAKKRKIHRRKKHNGPNGMEIDIFGTTSPLKEVDVKFETDGYPFQLKNSDYVIVSDHYVRIFEQNGKMRSEILEADPIGHALNDGNMFEYVTYQGNSSTVTLINFSNNTTMKYKSIEKIYFCYFFENDKIILSCHCYITGNYIIKILRIENNQLVFKCESLNKMYARSFKSEILAMSCDGTFELHSAKLNKECNTFINLNTLSRSNMGNFYVSQEDGILIICNDGLSIYDLINNKFINKIKVRGRHCMHNGYLFVVNKHLLSIYRNITSKKFQILLYENGLMIDLTLPKVNKLKYGYDDNIVQIFRFPSDLVIQDICTFNDNFCILFDNGTFRIFKDTYVKQRKLMYLDMFCKAWRQKHQIIGKLPPEIINYISTFL
jgi:hypothetical protein